MGSYKMEDEMWQETLRTLAAHFGANEPVETIVVCVDPKPQWRHYKNVWHNAGIRSALHMVTAPCAGVGRKGERIGGEAPGTPIESKP